MWLQEGRTIYYIHYNGVEGVGVRGNNIAGKSLPVLYSERFKLFLT